MLTVRTGPALALVGQATLLAVLISTAGLSWLGCAVGIAYGVAVRFALTWGLHRSFAVSLGPADWVTLVRAVFTGGILALVVESFVREVPVPLLVGLATAALLLDWADGQVARRTRTVSELGARFDMEVDAFLILVLSVYVAQALGSWVVAMGAMRYAFVAAGWARRWMRGQLPPRFWRKVVAAAQGVVLTIAASGVLPARLGALAVAGALALLVESFTRDVLWLYQHQPTVSDQPAAEVGTFTR